MRPVEAVSFDLDDTLRDPIGAAAALRRTAERLSGVIGIAADNLLDANAIEWAALWPEVEDAWTLGAMSGEEVTREAWRRTLGRCGFHDAQAERRATELHRAAIRNSQRLFADATRLLDRLDGRIRLALITNGASDTQRATLRALDLERRFDAVVISGEVGVAKPDPAAFQLVCDELGTDPAATWHVGDNLVTDIAGAKGAGLVTVWLNRRRMVPPSGLVEPDFEVGSLDDLMPRLTGARSDNASPQSPTRPVWRGRGR
jgi:putative hydrolase of the HAD superfamily